MSTKRWFEISENPNSAEVLSSRRNELKKVRSSKLIKNRIEYLVGLALGKSVLDIGVVEHFEGSAMEKTWLHQHIVRAADSCLGIDILESGVNALRIAGYNVIVHNVMESPLPYKYELIVVGDVIEHLDNPGRLFKNVNMMLSSGGRLVLTTPNPWYANALIKNIFEGAPFTDSVDHVAWFDAGTIFELAERNNLRLALYSGVIAEHSNTVLSKIFIKCMPLLLAIGVRRELFAKTIIYEFVLRE
jgi:2-polyprenyl-3-methyl-5-hydroxy-6-metoxy-1,4-benzoquinol methylase